MTRKNAHRVSAERKNDFAWNSRSRARGKNFSRTLIGPPGRFAIVAERKSAAQFGSEGQKRTAGIALKMAQAEFLPHSTAARRYCDDDVMANWI